MLSIQKRIIAIISSHTNHAQTTIAFSYLYNAEAVLFLRGDRNRQKIAKSGIRACCIRMGIIGSRTTIKKTEMSETSYSSMEHHNKACLGILNGGARAVEALRGSMPRDGVRFAPVLPLLLLGVGDWRGGALSHLEISVAR